MGVVFYRDIKDKFECDIKVEGTSLSESQARLLLKFKNRTLMFEGEISSQGHIKIDVPTLPDIPDDGGHAVLEVIAESTFFEAWKSDFELKKKKDISIQEVSISSNENKIVVENVSAERPKKRPISEKSKAPPKKSKSIYVEGCSNKNRDFAKTIFSKYETLNESQKKVVKDKTKGYQPNKVIESWGRSVFRNPNTLYAKMCMMELQRGLRKVND